MVLKAPKAMAHKGYILTAPDLVPMAMMRSSGSKARALGWLGKPCSTVCGRGKSTCTGTAVPWPTEAYPKARFRLCCCCCKLGLKLGPPVLCACVLNCEMGNHTSSLYGRI